VAAGSASRRRPSLREYHLHPTRRTGCPARAPPLRLCASARVRSDSSGSSSRSDAAARRPSRNSPQSSRRARSPDRRGVTVCSELLLGLSALCGSNAVVSCLIPPPFAATLRLCASSFRFVRIIIAQRRSGAAAKPEFTTEFTESTEPGTEGHAGFLAVSQRLCASSNAWIGSHPRRALSQSGKCHPIDDTFAGTCGGERIRRPTLRITRHRPA
jgi:hypothetical protein